MRSPDPFSGAITPPFQEALKRGKNQLKKEKSNGPKKSVRSQRVVFEQSEWQGPARNSSVVDRLKRGRPAVSISSAMRTAVRAAARPAGSPGWNENAPRSEDANKGAGAQQ